MAALYIWWKSGSDSGGQIPGSDEFVNNQQAAQNMIDQIGSGQPTPEQCKSIKTWYDAAVAGLGKMQTAGVQSQALQKAQAKLDAIKKFMDDHCG